VRAERATEDQQRPKKPQVNCHVTAVDLGHDGRVDLYAGLWPENRADQERKDHSPAQGVSRASSVLLAPSNRSSITRRVRSSLAGIRWV
jgi:hypothetical protein